jgi:excisionase family DNA binding protein
MQRITFDQLPEMVALLLEKVQRIEKLLSGNEMPLHRIEKEMLTTDEAAEFMGVSKSTVYKMSHSHSIPLYKPTGGRVYFKKEDILSYLQQNRIMSQEEIEQEAINYVINNPSKRRANRIR